MQLDPNSLSNMAMVAAERFEENAKVFDQLIDHTPNPDDFMQIHGDGARRMADQFRDQAREARHMAEVFASAYSVEVKTYA